MMNQAVTGAEALAPSLKEKVVVFLGGVIVAVGAGLLVGRLLAGAYGDQAAWYMVRSSGTVAYLLLAGSTLWGLLLSTQLVKDWVPGAVAMVMHSALSWLSIFTAGAHALLLLFDNYYSYGPMEILLPFIGPYRPLAVGLGVVGLYLALLTSASFQWRRWLGMGRWRLLHKLTFAAYILVTAHGLLAGSDSGLVGMQMIYAGSGLLVLLLTNYRLLNSA